MSFAIPMNAGETFSTEDNIKARGINLSMSLPEGLTPHNGYGGSVVQAWQVETQGLTVLVRLSMAKHHLHTHDEKLAEIAMNKATPGAMAHFSKDATATSVSSVNKKIGNEPAVINEYECRGTYEDGKQWNYYVMRLDLYPGDTWINLECHVGRVERDSRPLMDGVNAVRPALLKMLNSVRLN